MIWIVVIVAVLVSLAIVDLFRLPRWGRLILAPCTTAVALVGASMTGVMKPVEMERIFGVMVGVFVGLLFSHLQELYLQKKRDKQQTPKTPK